MSESPWFRWATTSARTLIGTAAAVAVTALVVTAVSAPWPVVTREPRAIEALPEPADAVSVCPGPALALGRNPEDAQLIAVAADSVPVVGVGQGAPAPRTELLNAESVAGGADVPAFVAPPVDSRIALLAAASSVTLADDDLAGFAAAACRPPLTESWVVGGQDTTGAAAILLISNPGTVTATVQLTVFGALGAQVPPGAGALAVPAGTQVALPLAGISGGEERPVIRVSATGAPVAAALQSSIVRTLVPGGLDVVSPIAASDSTQVIAGVTVAPGEDSADTATLVRILAPGAAASATITVTAVASAFSDRTTVELGAGVPAEVALGQLPVGEYVVTVAATAPVVAAAWRTTGLGEGADFAWYPASPRIPSATVVAVPDGPAPRLVLANRGPERAEVVLETPGVPARTVPVPVEGTAALDLAPGTVWTLDPGGATALYVAVSFSGGGALAGFPVWPADAGAEAVVVYP